MTVDAATRSRDVAAHLVKFARYAFAVVGATNET